MDFFSEKLKKMYCNFCLYSDKIDINQVVIAEEYCTQWRQKWQKLTEQMNQTSKELDTKKGQLGDFYTKVEKLISSYDTHDQRGQKLQIGMSFLIEKITLANQQVQEVYLQTRADLMHVQNVKFQEYQELLNQSSMQIRDLTANTVAMATIKQTVNEDEEMKLILDEGSQKMINEYLLRKIQQQNKILFDYASISSEFKSIKEFTERQTNHLDSKISQFMHFQEASTQQFTSELSFKMDNLESRIRTSIMFEISGELEKKQILDEQRRNRMNDILVQLNNNQVSEELYKKTGEKVQMSFKEIGSIYQSPTTCDTIVQAWNNNAAVLDQDFQRKSVLSVQADEIMSMIQIKNLLVCHCGHQDKTLFAFDVNDSFLRKFQSRTIERSYGGICKLNNSEDSHFILGMRYGWIAVYEVSVLGGINEKGSKQVFPGLDVLCIAAMNQEGIYAVGCQDYGITLIKIEVKTKQQKNKYFSSNEQVVFEIQRLQYHFLKDKSISSIVETKPNVLVCVSSKDCKYYKIDFFRFLETVMGQGYSSRGIALIKFPTYHNEKFPILLSKESEHVCIVDSENGNIYKLAPISGFISSDCSQQRLLFLNGSNQVQSQFTFVTDDEGVNLVKYEIDLDLIDVLRKIHV
ncbi:UNKNOWN [Stylonychia lemnae]|uniref:Uncharacterized protein n=1 Tax=Stylonychia lemnae TaxID=5949 RepID=A0A078AD27_STYLE|nr:UNKNOWN [Stylonychia lemnae]|eukprot:CDW78763.1 UNKNOWN [Stylonychia lemnae]